MDRFDIHRQASGCCRGRLSNSRLCATGNSLRRVSMTSNNNSNAGRISYAVAPERMPVIPDDKMTAAQKKASAEIAAGPRGEVKGPFVALLRSPEFMSRVQKVGEYIRFICPLDKRINEFAAIIA